MARNMLLVRSDQALFKNEQQAIFIVLEQRKTQNAFHWIVYTFPSTDLKLDPQIIRLDFF